MMNSKLTSFARFLLPAVALWFAAGTVNAEEVSAGSVASDYPLALGWLENMRLMPERMLMKAKLDSGAKSNVIHASDVELFEKDGTDFVRFDVLKDHDDESSERITLEKEILGEVAIKLRYTTERDVRLVVMLDFCMAGQIYQSRFTLTNRSDYNYPVLLGRDFIAGRFLIDSSESYTHRTRCPRI